MQIVKILIFIAIPLAFFSNLHPMQPKKLETQIEKALRNQELSKAENLIKKLKAFKDYRDMANKFETELTSKKYENKKKKWRRTISEQAKIIGELKQKNSQMETTLQKKENQLKKCKNETTSLKARITELEALKGFTDKKKCEETINQKNRLIVALRNRVGTLQARERDLVRRLSKCSQQKRLP